MSSLCPSVKKNLGCRVTKYLYGVIVRSPLPGAVAVRLRGCFERADFNHCAPCYSNSICLDFFESLKRVEGTCIFLM